MAVLVLVLAALPLLAEGAWMLRVVLVIAAVTALVSGCVLYCIYPRFRHWASQEFSHTAGASK